MVDGCFVERNIRSFNPGWKKHLQKLFQIINTDLWRPHRITQQPYGDVQNAHRLQTILPRNRKITNDDGQSLQSHAQIVIVAGEAGQLLRILLEQLRQIAQRVHDDLESPFPRLSRIEMSRLQHEVKRERGVIKGEIILQIILPLERRSERIGRDVLGHFDDEVFFDNVVVFVEIDRVVTETFHVHHYDREQLKREELGFEENGDALGRSARGHYRLDAVPVDLTNIEEFEEVDDWSSIGSIQEDIE